jgi:hypothetical protein
VAPDGSEYEAFFEESELTNLNDDDYVEEDNNEEEDEDEGMLIDDYINTNKGTANTGKKRKQEQRRMVEEIDWEVPDSENDEDARPKKKTKDSTAAKGLIPKDEVVEPNLKQGDGKKKVKEKMGWLLHGAVNAHRSERNRSDENRSQQNQGPVKDSAARAALDKPKRYVIPATCTYADAQSTYSLLSGLDQQCDSKI